MHSLQTARWFSGLPSPPLIMRIMRHVAMRSWLVLRVLGWSAAGGWFCEGSRQDLISYFYSGLPRDRPMSGYCGRRRREQQTKRYPWQDETAPTKNIFYVNEKVRTDHNNENARTANDRTNIALFLFKKVSCVLTGSNVWIDFGFTISKRVKGLVGIGPKLDIQGLLCNV